MKEEKLKSNNILLTNIFPHILIYSKFNNAKWAVEAGLNAGLIPKLTDFGSSGTYLLQDVCKKPVAIFKA